MSDIARMRSDIQRQITSWDKRVGKPSIPKFMDNRYASEFARKCVDLRAGEKHPVCDIEGAGAIVRLWFTVPAFLRLKTLRDLVIRIWWDGEDSPSVEVPLGDMVGAYFGRYRQIKSRYMNIVSGGFNFSFPMPFGEGARVEIANEGQKRINNLFYALNYFEWDSCPDDLGRFHASWRRENPTVRGEPTVVCEAEGGGHFVGCVYYAQNIDRFLKWPPIKIFMPHGFGMGNLEGWETIRVDDQPPFHGTGGEDYFNGGWYYINGKSHSDHFGCVGRSYFSGRAASYRLHIDDPIPFKEKFLFTLENGFNNVIRCDNAATAFWYQREPHGPRPALPPANKRYPSPWTGHALQFFILLTPLWLLVIILLKLLI